MSPEFNFHLRIKAKNNEEAASVRELLMLISQVVDVEPLGGSNDWSHFSEAEPQLFTEEELQEKLRGKSLALKLRVLRLREGLSQMEMGTRLGLSQQLVSRYEIPGYSVRVQPIRNYIDTMVSTFGWHESDWRAILLYQSLEEQSTYVVRNLTKKYSFKNFSEHLLGWNSK